MGVQLVPFKDKLTDFRALLAKMEGQMAAALPKHIKVERMMRIVLTTVQRIPKLLDCTQQSLLGSLLQAAQLGLEPDGILGEAYLIPYRDNKRGVEICQLIPGYRGLVKLARNSGQVGPISARIVHSKDEFRYSFGLRDVLKHKPSLDPDAGGATHGYAVAHLKDGGIQFDVMSEREIEAIRKRSRAGNSGPWVTDWEEMAKKTVLRRLCKLLPASVELQRAVALDEQVDANLTQTFETVLDVDSDAPAVATGEAQPEARASKLDALAAKVQPAIPPKGRHVVIVGADGSETPAVSTDQE